MAETELPGEAADAGREPPVPRLALIFVPGMGELFIDQSVDGIAIRVADALDREAPSAARFGIDPEVREESFGQGRKASACTIVRTDDGEATVALDVYRLDGIRALRGQHEASGFLRKAFLPALVLASYIPRALRARKQQAKSGRERRQLDYAVLVIALLTVYLVGLLVAGTISVLNVIDPNVLDLIPERVQSLWQGGVVALTALGLWQSNRLQGITGGAVGYVAVAGYLDRGDRRDNLIGELAALLEHIAEKDRPRYERVDIMAFSFGGIAALDAFFREETPPGPRFAEVETLVTIGCPFDFVRSYWPRYFAARVGGDGPEAWLNAYSPLDILSSNFRNDSEVGDAEIGIPTSKASGRKPTNLAYKTAKTVESMSRLEFFAFTGLSSHSIYWGRKAESEETVFRPVVKTMYAGERIIA